MQLGKTIRRQTKAARGAFAASFALMLAACGGEAPGAETQADAAAGAASGEAAVSDVCAWISDDEFERVLGARPSAAAPAAGLPGCLWSGRDGLPLLQVTLAPNAAASAADYAARLTAELGEAWSTDDLQPVEGLGDFAFYTPDARMLQVFRGRRVLQILVSNPAGDAEAILFARALLARAW